MSTPQTDLQEVLLINKGNVSCVACQSRYHLELLKKRLTFSYTANDKVGRKYRIVSKQEALYWPSIRAMAGLSEESSAGAVSGKDFFFTHTGLLPVLAGTLRDGGFEVKKADGRTQKPRPLEFDTSMLEQVTLRHKQDEVIRAVLTHPRGRILCPTGYGKSFLIAVICSMLRGARIVVTTHFKSVLTGLYDAIKKLVGPRDVGIRCSGRTVNTNARILVVGGKSLGNIRFEPDIVLCDENHEMCSEAYRRVFSYPVFQNARLFGFSANRTRADSRHYLMQAVFGPVLLEMTYQEAVTHGMVVPIRVRMYRVTMPYNPVRWMKRDGTKVVLTGAAKERSGIWANETRNRRIAEAVSGFGPDRRVLIVVKTIKHMLYLKQLLPDYELVYRGGSIDWSDFQELLPKDFEPLGPSGVEWMAKRFREGEIKHVIAAPVWNRGVDFPTLGVLVRADAAASVVANTQIPGRVSRLSEGKEEGLVIDFIDMWDKSFQERSRRRMKDYQSFGWIVEEAGDAPDK
jgi:superfamily II DNA or RNA helicase